MVALIGFAERAEDVYNSLAVVADGAVQGIYRKMFLPNYGVFDEQRYFQVGDVPATIAVESARIGLTICEDIWEPGPPASDEALAGAEVIVNISASPYHMGKGIQRERMLIQRARDSLAYVVFCNLVGGQDELVFDGYSLVIDQDGEVIARGEQFDEELIVSDIDPSTAERARLRDARHRAAARARRPDGRRSRRGSRRPPRHNASEVGGTRAEPSSRDEPRSTARSASACATTSTRTASSASCSASPAGSTRRSPRAIAVDALGAERVACAVMPSPHSSEETQRDARAACGEPRHRAVRALARAGDGQLRRRRCGRCSTAASRGSPRRTSRRGSAATC